MELQPGDWVRAESGEVGRVVHTARMSVFVELEGEPKEATLKAYLLSQLTKIDHVEPDAEEPPRTDH